MTRSVFIDCGGHCGCSRRFFKKYIDKKDEFEMYSFEADPAFKQYCPELISRAVWTKNGTIDFYKFGISGGSSLNEFRATTLEKQTRYSQQGSDPKQIIRVQCIDLNQWVKENFNKKDYIILKLDVECAEYDIIPHMIKKGSINYINKLYIEWHEDVKCGCEKNAKDKLTAILNSRGINVEHWDAMNCKKNPKGCCVI